MNSQIENRINIAESFNSTFWWEGKSQKRKNKLFQLVALSDYGLLSILLVLLIVISAFTLFGVDYFTQKWANAGIFTLMTISLSYRAPFSYIELLLKRHVQKIAAIESSFDNNLNIQLENIVNGFNRRKKIALLTGIPVFIIVIAAALQVFDVNPYWDKFPLFVFVVAVFQLLRMNFDIYRLRRNLGSLIDAVK